MIWLFVGLCVGALGGAGAVIWLVASMKDRPEGHAPVYPPRKS